MPRIRTIKPEFPQSESMGSVSRDARLLFILLWALADDSGRLRGNSRMLASLLFPYDDDAPSQIEGWLGELESQSCIVRYQADDGGNYVQVSNWLEHQKIDKASESKLPSPESCTIREPSRKLSNPRESSRPSRPSRARADQGPGSRTKDQGEDREGIKEDCNEVASPPSLPPSSLKYPDFPCVKGKASDKQVWTFQAELLKRFSETFTAVDVESECRKAHAWIMARPSRRKTAGGMEDFLRRWMAREQDSARTDRPVQKTFADMRVERSKQAIEEFANG